MDSIVQLSSSAWGSLFLFEQFVSTIVSIASQTYSSHRPHSFSTYLKLGHIIQTPHMLILIICKNKQNIGLAGGHGQPRKQKRAQKLHLVCLLTCFAAAAAAAAAGDKLQEPSQTHQGIDHPK